jgi:hypothetical protein
VRLRNQGIPLPLQSRNAICIICLVRQRLIRKKLGSVVLGFIGLAGLLPSHAVVINEFMAVNDSTITNAAGAVVDWVEIHNPATNTVSLTGWHLTDNAGNLAKWTFPSTNLSAGAFLLIFASGENTPVINGELHADFRLGGGGEYLALVDATGANVVHEYAPTYPPQSGDISYGLGVTNELRFFTSPTPGLPNNSGFERVEALRVSHQRGLYTNSFLLTIESDTPAAVITYTLDGSRPEVGLGEVYTTPLNVSSTLIVRAIGSKPGDFLATEILTQSYIFPHAVLQQTGNGFPDTWGHAGADYEMDPEIVTNHTAEIVAGLQALPTVSVATAPDDIFAAGGVGIYPAGEGQPRAASFELFDSRTGESVQENCSIEIFGGSSVGRWKTDKLQFRLRFNNVFGPASLDYAVFGPDHADRFDNLVLDARLANTWTYGGGVEPAAQRGRAQFVRDQFIPDLQRHASGFGVQGRHVHLYIDGLYWGIHGLHERPDESFGAAYFGGEREHYDVVKHNQNTVVHGSNANYLEMMALAALGLSGDAEYAAIQDYVDLEALADYMIVNFYAGYFDWAHQNWYVLRNNIGADTRWRFITWDAEHGIERTTDNTTTKDNAGAPTGLHQDLAANVAYRLLFADRAHKHMFNDGALTPSNLVTTYLARLDIVEPAVFAESARWGDNQREPPFRKDVEWDAEKARLLGTYFPQRTAALLGQLRTQGLYPSVDAPEFSQFGGAISNGFMLSMTAPNTIFYTLDGSDPRDPGTGAAQGLIYAAAIPLIHATRVKARAHDGATWSALAEAVFTVPTVGDLFVSELMYHPRDVTPAETNVTGSRSDFEFVELQNRGNSPVGLAGLTFSDGILFDFADSPILTLAPNDYLVIVRNLDAFKLRHANWASMNIAGEFGQRFSFSRSNLANGGERLIVQDALGTRLVDLAFGDSRLWPIQSDGAGHSLVPRVWATPQDGSMDYHGHWRASAYIDGSPGTTDPTPPLGVLINELNAHTDTALPPPNDSDDWIELFNPNAAPMDISGWMLGNSRDSLQTYVLPTGTLIQAGHFLRLSENLHFHTNRTDGSGFGLNKAGEQIYLSTFPGGGTDRVVDAVRFKGQENSISWGRYPDGNAFWQTLPATPETNNAPPDAHVVISEIMYNASTGTVLPDSIFEYIELYNPLSTTALLWNATGSWRIDGGIDYDFPAAVQMPPNSYLLLVPFDPADTASLNAFNTAYALTNEQVTIEGPYRNQLDNRTERVALERPQDPDALGQAISWVVVDEATYFDGPPWPAGTDGEGAPLQRAIGSHAGDDPTSWFNGFIATPGTPGTPLAIASPEHAGGHFVPQSLPIHLSLDPALDTNDLQNIAFFDGTNLLCTASNAPFQCDVNITEVRDYTLYAVMHSSSQTLTSRQVVVHGLIATNLAATVLTEHSATVNARIVGQGADTVLIYVGTQDGGTDPGAWSFVLSTAKQPSGDYSAALTGLVPGTSYFYRAFGITAFSSGWADISAVFATQSLSNWDNRLSITFPGAPGGTSLTNFPALVRLSESIPGFSYDQISSPQAYDMRFAETASGQLLPYEISEWNTNGVSEIWVRVPTLNAATQIDAYWGNASLPETPPAHNPNEVWSADYMAVWHLNGNLDESSGSAYRATATGALATAGVSSDAFHFNAAPDAIPLGIPTADIAAQIQHLTLSLWARPDADITTHASPIGIETPGHELFISINTIPFVRRWQMKIESSIYSPELYALNEWQMLALVLDAGTARAAVNDNTAIPLGPYGNFSPSHTLILGKRNDTGHHFKGDIDECRISHVARSPEWLLAEHDSIAEHNIFTTYGQVVRQTTSLDEDSDGMPDSWEIQWLGSTSANASAHADLDGLSNYQEFIAGTDPTNSASYFWLSISNEGPALIVGFDALAAEGPGYEGRVRIYDLLFSTDGVAGVWHGLPNHTNITGNNQWLRLTNAPLLHPTYFRAQTHLE